MLLTKASRVVHALGTRGEQTEDWLKSPKPTT